MKFWFEFEGYCSVEAENEEEAREKFWNNYRNKTLINEFFEITEITLEEEEEEE